MHTKNRGSILQITVYILFLLILNVSTICMQYVLNQDMYISSIKNDQQRLSSVLIFHYFRYLNRDDILLSDEIITEDYQLNYTVDDMGDYLWIQGYYKSDESHFSFSLNLDVYTNVYIKTEYEEYDD